MDGLAQYRVTPSAAQRYLEQGATPEELDRYRRWCVANGAQGILDGNVVQVTAGVLYSTVRYQWGASGPPTQLNQLYGYAVGQAFAGAGSQASLRETNLRQPGMLATDESFLGEAWGVTVRPTAFASANNAQVTEAATALANALALTVVLGQAYRVDRGPISPAMLTQPQTPGYAFGAAAPDTPISSVGPSVGRPMPLAEPWDVQPGVQLGGSILAGDLTTVPPGSDDLDGVEIDVTVIHYGWRRALVAG